MCTSNVAEEVEVLFAQILRDLCLALCPEDPDSVVVGPVDFGAPDSKQ